MANVKFKYHIKHRRAIWLLAVRDYLISKKFYKVDAETLIEFRKVVTDKKEHIFYFLRGLNVRTGIL